MSEKPVEGLIELLGSPNLRVRMLATDEITDRIGAAAVGPLVALLGREDSSAYQRAHAMWALHRLGGLDDALLGKLSKDREALVRVHAMRVLAEMAQWNDARSAMALAGLSDDDALVRRCAADALGAHADAANARKLLDALSAADPADTHLVYVIRMALRDCLKADGAFARLGELSAGELRAVAGVALAVPTPAAAEFLMGNLERLKAGGEKISAYTHHALRCAGRERIAALLREVRAQLRDDLEEQFGVLGATARGFAERGETPSPEALKWATELVGATLAKPSVVDDPNWRASPLDDSAPRASDPWVIQLRASADGVEAALFWCSLPRGEQFTGVLRSAPFTIPTQLSFFIAGHNGRPGTNPPPKNLVRLRSADDKSVLAEALVPRNDLAQPVKWDLQKHSSKQGYLELVDANDGPDYAWLAAGRFQPEVVPLPPAKTFTTEQQRIVACQLVGSLRLTELRGAMAQRLHDRELAPAERSAAATALVALDPQGSIDELMVVTTDSSQDTGLRSSLINTLPGVRSPPHIAALIGCFIGANWSFQRTLAHALAKTPEGAEAFFTAAEQDKAPRAMLHDIGVRMQLVSSGAPNVSARITELTRGLPAISEELNRLARARLANYQRALGDPSRGAKSYNAVCAACHVFNGAGGRAGPQLDGIGSRGAERVIEDILEPNRNVDPSFRYVNLYLTDGRIISGIKKRDEGEAAVYVDATGKEITVPNSSVKRSVPSMLSLMPSGLTDAMSGQDFNDLVAYLLKSEKKANATAEPQSPGGIAEK